MASITEDEMGKLGHEFKASPENKKAKTKWVKQYLSGSKGRKSVRKSHPKDDSPIGVNLKYWRRLKKEEKRKPPSDRSIDGPNLEYADRQ
ncbi:hypothetical protein HAX54_031391 [Datura stramonium]|uniref:Uncharacterized protein n=1 Tax=Datura stramonium TaxID=4076 RepID=A0ABS8SC34_DATST|nr:hypothetical protein [Datura stramonium]